MGRPKGPTAPRKTAEPLKEKGLDVKVKKQFYADCLAILKEKFGDSSFYLPQLEMYVVMTLKAAQLATDIAVEGTTTQYTNRAGHTNNSENPKVRLFKMMNEQAMKLGKDLGLSNISKVRKTVVKDSMKRGFKLDGKV